jgi:hypothetical protein
MQSVGGHITRLEKCQKNNGATVCIVLQLLADAVAKLLLTLKKKQSKNGTHEYERTN